MEDLVSVIIPAYNVEKYIRKCVESIITQSYNNIEIIIVNDGSSDNTATICRELISCDNRIMVINQDNKGLSVARNVGYSHSHGKWICFIDSDDWVDNRFVESLLDLVNKYNADIAACKSRNVDEKGNIKNISEDTHKEYVFKKEEVISSLNGVGYRIRFEVWNKLWSRKLIDSIRFVEGQVSEDVHFDRIALMKADRIVYTDTTLHNYRVQRPGNTNSSFKIARLCVFDEFDMWIKELAAEGRKKEVLQIGAIACTMALGLFSEAIRTRQDDRVKKRVKSEFDRFYSYISNTEENRIKYRIFQSSPLLYCAISRMWKLCNLVFER